MHHDFDDKLGSKSCKSTPTEKCCFGFMHYGNHKNEWSDCSVREFRQNHRKLFAPKNCLGGIFLIKCNIFSEYIGLKVV